MTNKKSNRRTFLKTIATAASGVLAVPVMIPSFGIGRNRKISLFDAKQDTLEYVSIAEDRFANPSMENRPMALWTWMNGYVDTKKMVYELEEMKAKGMRGAIVWDLGAIVDPQNLIPAGPAYLGPESLEYISLALKTCEELDLDLGLSVASSWNSGGEWVAKEDGSMQLLNSREVVTGPSRKKIEIGVPKSNNREAEHYSLITSIAIPYTGENGIEYSTDTVIQLDSFTSEDKYIEWDVPEGDWEVLSFFMSNTMQNLVVPSPNSVGLLIDHLSKEANTNHFNNLFSRIKAISNPEDRLKFLFIDSYEVMQMKDWTPVFIQEFRSRYHYDPVPYLPFLQGFNSKDSFIDEKFRGDYSRLVSDLMVENHYGLSSEMANKHGMQVFAEAGHGGNPRVDPLKAMGHSDIPMGEFWNLQRHWVTKEAASAANIYGKKIVA